MRRRNLSQDERQLWHRVTKDVKALRPTPRPETPKDIIAAPQSPPVSHSGHGLPLAHASHQAPVHREPTKAIQSVFEAGDPRIVRHVSRGRKEIDATLDLHGMTQDEAYAALQQFLMLARTQGHRVLLVITGKGSRGGSDIGAHYSVSRGILRQRFLQWVEGPFREYVSSVKTSHQRHGGGGAFYVFLKKRQDQKSLSPRK